MSDDGGGCDSGGGDSGGCDSGNNDTCCDSGNNDTCCDSGNNDTSYDPGNTEDAGNDEINYDDPSNSINDSVINFDDGWVNNTSHSYRGYNSYNNRTRFNKNRSRSSGSGDADKECLYVILSVIGVFFVMLIFLAKM